MTVYEMTSECVATPQTIWETCFAEMKWEKWCPDIRGVEIIDFHEGATEGRITMIDNNGGKLPATLYNVVKNKSVFFRIPINKHLEAEGSFLITPVTSTTSRIDASYEIKGCHGLCDFMLRLFQRRTERNVRNVAALSGKAQEKKPREASCIKQCRPSLMSITSNESSTMMSL